MPRSADQLRADALQIWHAGLEAVRSDRLVQAHVRVDGQWLVVGDQPPIDLECIGRIAVVGAGKAGTGMAAAIEEALGPKLIESKELVGWVNVPADCVPLAPEAAGWPGLDRREAPVAGSRGFPSVQPRPPQINIPDDISLVDAGPVPRRIHLHAARPAGRNEPTAAGVAGTEEILKIVGGLGPEDLCLCLISGGGSALLPAPAEGISLADKLAVTRHLSAAGADIRQLNTVRKQLSRIKGGGLARACRAGLLVSLVISDVLGDPLDLIASGPTVPDHSTPADALAVLREFDPDETAISSAVYQFLHRKAAMWVAGVERSEPPAGHAPGGSLRSTPGTPTLASPHPSPLPEGEGTGQCQVRNIILGNNATAVDAAGLEAERLGYSHAMICAREPEGLVEPIGRHLAEMAVAMRDTPGPDCLIAGGEGAVKLAPETERGLGGRNQQLALAALMRLQELGPERIALVSAGTDGEDGPTDAAGAIVDAELIARATAAGLDPAEFLSRDDAYHFFQPLGGLLKTGPTHTNVCDVRIVTVERSRQTADGSRQETESAAG